MFCCLFVDVLFCKLNKKHAKVDYRKISKITRIIINYKFKFVIQIKYVYVNRDSRLRSVQLLMKIF